MKRLAILALTSLVLTACSSSDTTEPNYPPRSRPPMDGEGSYAARPMGGSLDMLPPAGWWHQPILADAVKLTGEQMSALDKISNDQGDDIARIDRDSMVAVRDLRQLLDSNQPSTNDIVAAAQRLRALRDAQFDKQAQMLAAERQVLSQQQWATLQQQLQQRRTQRNQDYPRRGGRGMGGGRGRWPGY